MKKALTAILAAAVFISQLTGCSQDSGAEVPAAEDVRSGKIEIVATLFPQYDVARQIAGDKAEVMLLLPPGVESHSFEPTPSDLIKINQSDLFLYTGKYMEIWSQKIIENMKDTGSRSLAVDLSRGISLISIREIKAERQRNGESGQQRDGESGQQPGGETEPASAQEFYDPHIWADPLNVKVMVSNILDALSRIDPANAGYYKENAENYSRELDRLDAEFRAIVNGGKRKEIIVGSEFALYYFAKQYGLNYEAAFGPGSEETEPSARTVASMIKKIREEKIPVIYYGEIEDPKVARSISAETGARMLLFHSAHNVTKQEMESGVTYLSLMKQNAENLKEGLK